MRYSHSALVIELLGGTMRVAQICRVTPAAVSQWKLNGIPNARTAFLRLAFPDVFVYADRIRERRQKALQAKAHRAERRRLRDRIMARIEAREARKQHRPVDKPVDSVDN